MVPITSRLAIVKNNQTDVGLSIELSTILNYSYYPKFDFVKGYHPLLDFSLLVRSRKQSTCCLAWTTSQAPCVTFIHGQAQMILQSLRVPSGSTCGLPSKQRRVLPFCSPESSSVFIIYFPS